MVPAPGATGDLKIEAGVLLHQAVLAQQAFDGGCQLVDAAVELQADRLGACRQARQVLVEPERPALVALDHLVDRVGEQEATVVDGDGGLGSWHERAVEIDQLRHLIARLAW